MNAYQNATAISIAACVALVALVGIVALSAVLGNLLMAFFACGGVVCAVASIIAADSIAAEHRREYFRRIQS